MSSELRMVEQVWWSPHHVPVGETLEGRLGPLALAIHRAAGEWQVGFEQGAEDGVFGETQLTRRPGGLAEAGEFERFMFARSDTVLFLVPVLADRPVVIRPRQPVFLPSGEQITLYVSTPVSVRVEVGEGRVLLREVPAVRLSDTWFGPSTREGELCYSGRTHARTALDDVPRRAYRAITPARIRNEAETPLPLDKLSLPVPVLSVYGAVDGNLWTEGVSLVRRGDSQMAALKIDAAPPAGAGAVTLISGARQAQGRGGLVRAFSALFRDGP